LAQYAGQNGACFPSQQRLAADLGLSDRQVRRIVSELISKGFLEKEAPPYKEQIQGKTTKYFFLYHPIFRADESVLPGRSDVSGGSGQMCPVPTDEYVRQRESDKEKNEKGSSPPDFQKSQERARGILAQLGSNMAGPVFTTT
jgi:DNA-binding transcriptional MocR family regulator